MWSTASELGLSNDLCRLRAHVQLKTLSSLLKLEESERHKTKVLNKWETSEKAHHLFTVRSFVVTRHSFQRFVRKIIFMCIFDNLLPENEVARMHAKRVASRKSGPATRELYPLQRYGVCFGASKGCLILLPTSLSWLRRSFVVLLDIRHHFKK